MVDAVLVVEDETVDDTAGEAAAVEVAVVGAAGDGVAVVPAEREEFGCTVGSTGGVAVARRLAHVSFRLLRASLREPISCFCS